MSEPQTQPFSIKHQQDTRHWEKLDATNPQVKLDALAALYRKVIAIDSDDDDPTENTDISAANRFFRSELQNVTSFYSMLVNNGFFPNREFLCSGYRGKFYDCGLDHIHVQEDHNRITTAGMTLPIAVSTAEGLILNGNNASDVYALVSIEELYPENNRSAIFYAGTHHLHQLKAMVVMPFDYSEALLNHVKSYFLCASWALDVFSQNDHAGLRRALLQPQKSPYVMFVVVS